MKEIKPLTYNTTTITFFVGRSAKLILLCKKETLVRNWNICANTPTKKATACVIFR